MIALNDLVIKKGFHKIIFNLKQSLDPQFIILGEPIFMNYFAVLDYNNNRIGLSHQRTKFIEQIISVVFLIRFVIWAIILCKLFYNLVCILICFASPIQVFLGKGKKKLHTRKRKKYSPIEENPHDEMKGEISDTIQAPTRFTS